MAEAKVGDIKLYHDSGDIYKVEVLDLKDRVDEGKKGVEYRLKLLEAVDVVAINPLKSGLELTVWKSNDAGPYHWWHLSDR